jgi:two-component system OmpR family response regulator
MKVLVVEDDPAIAVQIVTGMQRLGHHTSVAPTGHDALRAAQNDQFDAVVLDRMLPDITGDEVLHHLIDRPSRPPILMLSALGSVSDRIDGLRAGADDYLAKPFEIEELAARLEAIARRFTLRDSSGNIAVGSLQLDPGAQRAFFKGHSIKLNGKQFSLLVELMRNADRLVTRQMLLESVWGYAFDTTTNIVESNLSRLRSKLVDIGCDAIETRRGHGYILASAACC